MDSPALTAIIDYWKDYDPKTVLLAYGELKRRNYSISDRLIKRQNEFCAKHNYQDIDTFLTTYFKENGYNSYNEYYEKEIGALKKAATENVLKNITADDNSENTDREPGRYTALKTVVGLISFLGYIVIIIGIGLLIFMASQEQALMGFVALVVSVVIALPLLAYSNLIYVLIDTEYNTRKTREAIDKLQTKK